VFGGLTSQNFVSSFFWPFATKLAGSDLEGTHFDPYQIQLYVLNLCGRCRTSLNRMFQWVRCLLEDKSLYLQAISLHNNAQQHPFQTGLSACTKTVTIGESASAYGATTIESNFLSISRNIGGAGSVVGSCYFLQN
jgi:hypothetical protein